MKRREKGFTLPELLVALVVFAMIAAASVYALRLGVEARDQLGEADKRLAEFETARRLIRDDMTQLRPRTVRDEYGAPAGPVFEGGEALRRRSPVEGEKLLLAFVRGGWANSQASAPRSTLQYVEYVEKNGAILRRVRGYLDDARGQRRVDRALFRDARAVEMSFLAGEARGALDWRPGWPFGGGAFPRAIRLRFDTSRYGRLEQLFWIGDIADGGEELS